MELPYNILWAPVPKLSNFTGQCLHTTPKMQIVTIMAYNKPVHEQKVLHTNYRWNGFESHTCLNSEETQLLQRKAEPSPVLVSWQHTWHLDVPQQM